MGRNRKLNISRINKIKIDNDYYKNHKIELIKNNYILNDSSSSYNKYNYNNQFEYAKKFLEFLRKNNMQIQNKIQFLCLGFGIGGIPLKASTFDFVKEIDCVDNDYSLFEIYNTINKKKPNKINLYHNDAIKYLECSRKKYDVILDDIYNGYHKIEFDYNIIMPRLKKNGFFILNLFIDDNLSRMIENLKNYFNVVVCIPANMNTIVICKK